MNCYNKSCFIKNIIFLGKTRNKRTRSILAVNNIREFFF